MNIYEGARRTRTHTHVRTATNHGDDDNPVSQFLVSKTYLGGKKNCLSKANKMIAWISRNIICKSKDVMVLIYRSLIRPHLEYCVQAWSPNPRFGNWGLILSIEKVQRKFTRLINDIGTLPYGARLQSLNLTTLAERRIRGDLIKVF